MSLENSFHTEKSSVDSARSISTNLQLNKTGLVAVYTSTVQNSDNEKFSTLKEQVRAIIDKDKTFEDAKLCDEFVRSVRYERIFLVVASDIVEEIFQENIPDIRHVQAVFIFDPQEKIWQIEEFRKRSFKVSIYSRILCSV